jgi:hypothetical protein
VAAASADVRLPLGGESAAVRVTDFDNTRIHAPVAHGQVRFPALAGVIYRVRLGTRRPTSQL